jgi:hypothetical protein
LRLNERGQRQQRQRDEQILNFGFHKVFEFWIYPAMFGL